MSYSREFRLLLAELGITNDRLPVEGLPPRDIFGVTFWVCPLPPRDPGARYRHFKLRVRCTCPTCGTEMSASRLKQHANTLTCYRAEKLRDDRARAAENNRAFAELAREAGELMRRRRDAVLPNNA